MSKKDFLTALADPDEYNIIVGGIDRTLEYYNDTFKSADYAEIATKNENQRTWRVLFNVKFRDHFPSLHMDTDLEHNFRRTDPSIHVTLNSFDLVSTHISLYVTQFIKERVPPSVNYGAINPRIMRAIQRGKNK